MFVIFFIIFCNVFSRTSSFESNNSDSELKYLRTKVMPQILTLLVDEEVEVHIEVFSPPEDIEIKFSDQHKEHFNITYKSNLWHNENKKFDFTIKGLLPGRFTIIGDYIPNDTFSISHLFVIVKVAKSNFLIYFSIIVGWGYTACWAIGYYPQMWINYKRRSVVGLSFDFLVINIVGHVFYAIFNCLLYWNPYIENEYFNRHPYGLNPVIGNDVGFALHASFATGITIIQCFFYDKGDQTVSKMANCIILSFFGTTLASIVFVSIELIHWLDFLYVLSYIKLITTLIKYFPQAYMNYERKSTTGFSIENRLLDMAGGFLSIFQMIINAYNYDDWGSILGDPVKFGLGLFSILFDIVFVVQHYFLYRNERKTINLKDLHLHAEVERLNEFRIES